MSKKITKKVLREDYQKQPFIWMTKQYGHAEFIICPIIKRGKMKKVMMYPVQQPEAKHYYEVTHPDGWSGIDFGTYLKNNNQLEKPWVWNTHYCKEHKSHSFRLYVPRESTGFFITSGLGKFCINWR